MEIKAEEISQIIRKQIEDYDQKVAVMETGTVLMVGDGIAREYRLMADEHAGRVRADVTSAQTLDSENVSRLKGALEQKTGKQIILEQKTDSNLIAGMVTKIGSIIYDGSIRTRLEQMRQALLEGEQ